jgi:hypothetical protein
MDVLGDSRGMGEVAGARPRAPGRLTGLCYLAVFVAGLISMALIPNTGVLSTYDAAKVDYYVAHQTAFWAGFPFLLLVVAFRLLLTLLFYELFRPVNRRLSLLAVFFNLVATTLQAGMAIGLLVPVVLLGDQQYAAAFSPGQLHALAVAAMVLDGHIYHVALVFFAGYELLLGYLSFTSGFIPRPVGVLMGLSGLGWLTFGIPPFAASLLPYNVDLGALGEVAMILWLIAMGVDARRWEERAGAAVVSNRP